MIAFNEVHLFFDLALELLCLLPRGERKEDGATFSDLIHDLGFRKPAELLIRFKGGRHPLIRGEKEALPVPAGSVSFLLPEVPGELIAPMQMAFQRSIEEASNEQFIANDMADRVTESTDEELWRKIVIMTVIATGAFSVYPVFLGLYLSRRSVTEETEDWH